MSNNINLSPHDFGAKGDGYHDDTNAFKKSIKKALENNSSIELTPGSIYRVTENLHFKKGGTSIRIFSKSTGSQKPLILFDIEKGRALNFEGNKVTETRNLISNVKSTGKFIVPDNTKNIKQNQLCEIMSTKSWYHDPRPPANPPVRWVGYNLGVARGGDKSCIYLSEKFEAPREHIIGRSFTLLDGENKGYSVTVEEFDDENKLAHFSPQLPNEILEGTNYLFPQAFKGELNLVEKVYQDKIELRNILFDGYDVKNDEFGGGKETVTLDFINPISILIENVTFDWKNHSGNRSQFEMIRVKYGNDCIFRNVNIKNASRIGFQIERCFNTTIENCGVESSNNNFLGYGVNVQNSTQTTITNSWFWGCRRGVDFDSVRDFGDAYPSRLGLVDSCTNYGGGTRQEGRKYEAPWYPEGNWEEEKSRNFGFGSHGPADHITYSNNTAINTYRGIFLRGTNERIINNKFIGKMEECIGIWFGGNHTIEGNEYIHPSISGTLENDENYRETSDFTGGDFRKDLPKRFIGIATLNHSAVNYQRGFITVRNNIARGLTDDFFYHQWSAGKYLEDITLENNHIVFWPNDYDKEIHLFNSNHSGVLINFIDKNNSVIVKNGNYYPYRFRNKFTENCTIIPWDIEKRKKIINIDEEISINSSFKVNEKNSNIIDKSIATIGVRPYSSLSKFRCTFRGIINKVRNPGTVIIGLFRGSKCVSSTLTNFSETKTPINISFEYIDEPIDHKDLEYHIIIGNYNNRDEIIVNNTKYTFEGTNTIQFTIEEI